jgi:SAM-dependent methyltransferase
LYAREITNHDLDPTDEGTIWFDDSAAEDKIVAFLSSQILLQKDEDDTQQQQQLLGPEIGRHNCSFLDLGTGNGHLLCRLREGEEEEEEDDDEGKGDRAWMGRMLGVDYSQKSVEFAKRVAADKGFGGPDSSSKPAIEFRWWDIMTQNPEGVVLEGPNEKGWDVVLDKGTFDAISLSKEKDPDGRRICEGYKERVVPLIRDGGILLVTSCNWTEEELKAWFVGGELEFVDTIKYKSFSFGGKKGQTISSICLRKHALR